MDRSEKTGSLHVAMKGMARNLQSNIWTAMPATLDSYDADKITCSAQPTIKGQWRDPGGKTQWIKMPLCVDVPVFFPSGGGYTLTFPLKKGDEGLLVFASRCIDAWWKQGGVQSQTDLRMHDLSDGFFFPQFWNQERLLSPKPSTDSTQLRSDDGNAFYEIKGAVSTMKNGDGYVKIDGGTTTIHNTKIVLDGTVYLGGADASRPVSAIGTVTSDGASDVSNPLVKVFGK